MTLTLAVSNCSYIYLVLEYIARYAYRVAITNSRILDLTDKEISYDYKQYKSGGKHRIMTTTIDGFLTLFSQHILPNRFVRIRHYGILSPCNREILRNIQEQLDVPPVPKVRKKKSYLEICNEKGDWNLQRLQLPAHHHKDNQTGSKSPTLLCLAYE